MKAITFTHGEYLGGHPSRSKRLTGPLQFDDGNVGIMGWGKLKWGLKAEHVTSIEIGGGEQRKSRVGAAVMLGVGALATKGTESHTDLIIRTRSGSQAVFRLERTDPLEARAKLQPWMTEHNVSWWYEGGGAPAPAPAADPVDRLSQLAQLHATGALSDAEFSAAKARILS